MRNQRLLGAGLDLLNHPAVAVRIGEIEESAAVALVDDIDLADGDTAPAQFFPRTVGVGDDELQALSVPGAMAGSPPITMEHPDPGGVSCANRISAARVSWSRLKPSRSR